MRKIITSLMLFGFLAVSSCSFAGENQCTDNASKYSVRAPNGNMPMVHWAVVMAKKGKQAEIGALAVKYVAPEVAKEEGTYALYGGKGIDTPENNILLEIYEDEEAYNKHVSSKGFLQYKKEREPIMEKLIILEAEAIALEQKPSGVGTVVYLNKFDIVPEKLEKYKKLAIEEATRVVRDEPNVMGMFFTAEKDNPNAIHIMTIFRYQSSFDKYFSSKEYLSFKQNYEPMLESFHEVKCLPTVIKFTGRGNRK